jgi:RHS repeat-associated protein
LKHITYGGGGTNTFTYDGTGRRVSKVDSTGSYSFVYDGNRIISDGQAVYTRAGGSRLISERRGNDSRWHHSDGLTSTRTLTNSSQTTTDTIRYDVWGDIAERTGNTPTPHQFVGALGYEREADSGLYFIGTRYYDPSVGRFISQDAAQWGVNWYIYAANNPVSGFDYQGQWWETALDIAGLILDVKDFIEKPSLGNAAWIIGDVASIILPTPTPSLIKHGGKLIKHGGKMIKFADDAADVGKHIDDVVDVGRQGPRIPGKRIQDDFDAVDDIIKVSKGKPGGKYRPGKSEQRGKHKLKRYDPKDQNASWD